MYKTLGGIVVFNPDIARLIENISSIRYQVDEIILIDNGSQNILEIEKIDMVKNIKIIKNGSNKGIAFALNQIIEYSKDNSFDWAITLDQDSVCPPNLVLDYSKYFDFEDIGIICPYNIDIKSKQESYKKGFDFVDWCITSASCINVSRCFNKVSFDEKMFIDLVDVDYSYQVRKNNLKILRDYDIVISHQLGDLKEFNIFHRIIEVTNHSPIRKYYYSRNCIYLCNKYKDDKTIVKLWRYKLKILILKTIIFEGKKLCKLKYIYRGIKNGRRLSKGIGEKAYDY